MGCGLIVMEMDLEAEEEKKVKHRDTEGAEKKGQKEKRAQRAVWFHDMRYRLYQDIRYT
jgi:hypothetical protein